MIILRSAEEIAKIRKAGEIVAATLETLKGIVSAGITTSELDRAAKDQIVKMGGHPAFMGYKGFPANICVSLNEVVVHGIPSARQLKDGDLVKVDVGVEFDGYFADAAMTMGVGSVSEEAARLMDVTEKSLAIAIGNAKPSRRLFDISHSVQEFVESNGFSVVRAFVGHGIGTKIHEDPEIPNFGKADRGVRLEPGMVLAIEPMVNAGTYDVEVLEDGWTAVTKDRRLSAHFEHTVVVTERAADILTK